MGCRRDMAALEKRTAAVDLGEGCASCGRPLAGSPPCSAGPWGGALPPLLLFPTGNAFHGACACAEAKALAPPPVAARISYLQQTLAQVLAATSPCETTFRTWLKVCDCLSRSIGCTAYRSLDTLPGL